MNLIKLNKKVLKSFVERPIIALQTTTCTKMSRHCQQVSKKNTEALFFSNFILELMHLCWRAQKLTNWHSWTHEYHSIYVFFVFVDVTCNIWIKVFNFQFEFSFNKNVPFKFGKINRNRNIFFSVKSWTHKLNGIPCKHVFQLMYTNSINCTTW